MSETQLDDPPRPRGEALLDALERGLVRVAERDGGSGRWRVNAWIKEEILALFRTSRTLACAQEDDAPAAFRDKQPFTRPRLFAAEEGVRVVPGGSAVRRGAFLGEGVVVMPPAYVNVGAWIGPGTMVDSHALVGSCAQIGARVHLSAAVQIGGVLEPPGARPVIVEDDCFVGGGCGLYEGVCVREGAVLGAGLILTATSRIYDLVEERVLQGTPEEPLEVPPRAVLVPGTRALAGEFAREHGLGAPAGLLVKLRDARTDRRAALEDALR